MRTRTVVVGTFAFATLLARPAAAESVTRRSASLTWVRAIDAERCVGAIGLEEDLKARLGYDPFTDPPSKGASEPREGGQRERHVDRRIAGFIARAAEGYRAEIVVRDDAGNVLGSRVLQSRDADCRSLGEAVAVAIVLALEPVDGDGTRDPFTSLPPGPAPEAPRGVVPSPAAHRRPPSRASLVSAGGAGLVPGTALGIGLRVLGRVDENVELGVSARFWPERSAGDGLSFALVSGAVEACFVPWGEGRPLSPLRWCAGVHGGAFHAFVAPGALSPLEVGMFPWAGVETGPALSLPLFGPVRLDAGASLAVPFLRRQAFLRGESEPQWEQSVVGATAELGLGASL